ncbi:MAG: RAD55 family ATPase, partial [Blastocatellia bacterium]
MTPRIFADAGDDGIRFILPRPISVPKKDPSGGYTKGGLIREPDQGHLITFAGRGGTGKSVLALQFLTELLRQSEKKKKTPAAFYFTLEASPLELVLQLQEFRFGQLYFFPELEKDEPGTHPDKLGNRTSLGGAKGTKKDKPGTDPDKTNSDNPNADDLFWEHEKGLYIHAIPSPIDDLTTLIRQVRQTIAERLSKQGFNDLVGIVIDPLGGVRDRDTLRTDLSGLKHLADSHKTFLFLLAEDHIYEQHRSIEHYSQTVLQLQYYPYKQPSRWIFVQKARSQPFRVGNHQL